MALTDEQDSAVVYLATREKLPVVPFRSFAKDKAEGVSSSIIDKWLDNMLNNPAAPANVRCQFLNWQEHKERKLKMDVKIVYTDSDNLTIRTSNRKTTKIAVEELDAIVSAYTELKGKIGDGCEGIERVDGKQWLLFADPSNEG